MRFVMSVVIHLTSFTSESSGRGKEEDSRDRKRERERKNERKETAKGQNKHHKFICSLFFLCLKGV